MKKQMVMNFLPCFEGRKAMKNATRYLARSFFVHGYEVTAKLTIVGREPQVTTFDWNPMPPRKRITHRFVVEYRKKRNEVMKLIANEIGGVIALVDAMDRRTMVTVIHPGDTDNEYRYL